MILYLVCMIFPLFTIFIIIQTLLPATLKIWILRIPNQIRIWIVLVIYIHATLVVKSVAVLAEVVVWALFWILTAAGTTAFRAFAFFCELTGISWTEWKRHDHVIHFTRYVGLSGDLDYYDCLFIKLFILQRFFLMLR